MLDDDGYTATVNDNWNTSEDLVHNALWYIGSNSFIHESLTGKKAEECYITP